VHNRLIGVVFFVNLDHPADVSGIWPTEIYEPKKPFPQYIERYEYFRVENLDAVNIEVDLERKKVAGVRPSSWNDGARRADSHTHVRSPGSAGRS
jgi:hypothetical protein